MIDIFGIQLPEPLFYTLIIAGAIFYVGMIWLVMQLMRRKMPTRVQKLGLGQSLEEYKCREDDTKIYWKEGILGRMHEGLKVTKERIKTHWGVPNKTFLVRRDFKLTIPYARSLKTSVLKLLNLEKEDMTLLTTHEDKSPDKPFPVDKLSDKAKGYISALRTTALELCDKCKKKVPEYITVEFMHSDQLLGSSTEATAQRNNEDFVGVAVKALKKIKKGDFMIALIFGISIGMLVTLVIMILSNIIKLG